MVEDNCIYQQSLVYDRLKETFQRLYDANQRLETKARMLATLSTALVALVGAARSLQPDTSVPSPLAVLFVVGMFCSALWILHLATKAWVPHDTHHPGPIDVSELYSEYISQEVDDAYNNALSDLSGATQKGLKRNDIQADAVTSMIRWLQIEIGFLLGALLYPLVQSWF